ncbi:6-pyruvoyl trahydropterin synthase family protein [Sulfolobus acidocaldarius]|uniref:Conserved Archaeal protein n=4 Tax=Sulfolobus acidocaldarius TaxID=2285 RepID=Q4JA84_SULAC|nr:6-carboxytetrahydropterin synthase [Sulfolobus acidocaldarius]AAY80296.1 conserved Archaeal protein [Sulfolobus acidocaldarius DSM 639]AGE70877.1 6-pyruvoyl tetrahydrobiopterin synthase [Sulfolobus acidocaldarius N8]AGE73148.1 6-pyruvoyl tetrahydrobiopterin synthase [Sulfolobus acidocaldarius Ron12/I]ALU28815.1 6-pyruvoyl tetrahydrobiopterin synthase [Sulfolobus acidocaldarius]ALU31535.1 6-pyruvoyl tetrahydrobiopterin synthase [Sulfolobus acidocaldarius]
MKVVIGVEGFSFDSAHYTLSSKGNDQIHGHTYKLSVEIEGQDVDKNSGFVIDFMILTKIIHEVIREWDHKLIIPSRDARKIELKGPFKVEYKIIEEDFPTVEYIGSEIAKDIYEKLEKKFKVRVKIYEGENSYALIEYP